MNVSWLMVILIGLNAFFSIAEFSIASSRPVRLQQWINDPRHKNQKKAIKVLELQGQPGTFITLVQVALNIITIVSGMVGEEHLTPWFEAPWIHFGVQVTPTIHAVAVACSVLCVTSLFIVFAELIPKKITFMQPEEWACRCIDVLLIFFKILKPLVWIYSQAAKVILSWWIKDIPQDHMTFEDVKATLHEGKETGVVDRQELNFIDNVFSLSDRSVSSAMTHKDAIVALDIREDQKTIEEKIIKHPHSRFVVMDKDLNHWLGYIPSSELLKRMIHKKAFEWEAENLKSMGVQNLIAVPDVLKLKDVLDHFRAQRQDIAMVLNEFGETVGLITLNDVLSTLMGEAVIPEEALIVQRDQNSWLMDGKTPMVDVIKTLGWSPDPSYDHFQTISGFLMFHMKCIPKKAQSMDVNDVHFEIVDIEKYRIDEVMVTKNHESKKLETKDQ